MKRPGSIVPLLFGVLFSLVLTACGSSDEQIAAAVQATLQAMPTYTPAATATPQPTQTPIPPTATSIPPTATIKPTATPRPDPTVTPTPMPPLFDDVKPLGCKLDEFQGIEWCAEDLTPDLEKWDIDINGDVNFVAYAGQKETTPLLRWRITYVGKDWIFLDAITVIVDGEKYDLPVDDLQDVKTETYDGGFVAEEFDREASSKQLPLAIAFADEVKVRLSGSDGNFDKVLTARELEVIRRALKTYEDKGGKFSPADIEKAGVFKE